MTRIKDLPQTPVVVADEADTRGFATRGPLDPGQGSATLAILRARVRAALPSVFSWPNATLDGWIADAIREYSSHLPRLWRYTLTLTTGTQSYDLPSDKGLLSIGSVEYPAGEDPPEFINLASEWASAFQTGDDVYALRGVANTVAIESDSASGRIVFAEQVTTGETAILSYYGLHTVPTAGDDDAQISVPQAHWRALIGYCVARAWDDLSLSEGLVVGMDGKALAEVSKRAEAAWERYQAIMTQLEDSASLKASSAILSWGDIGL